MSRIFDQGKDACGGRGATTAGDNGRTRTTAQEARRPSGALCVAWLVGAGAGASALWMLLSRAAPPAAVDASVELVPTTAMVALATAAPPPATRASDPSAASPPGGALAGSAGAPAAARDDRGERSLLEAARNALAQGHADVALRQLGTARTRRSAGHTSTRGNRARRRDPRAPRSAYRPRWPGEAHNLTVDALAERSGLHARPIEKIEAGESNVTLPTLKKLANALGVDPAALLRPPRASHRRRRA